MKKLIAITAVFALLACFLTACRFGGDDTTTTENPHTLPETTGATITMPTMDTTMPSTTNGNTMPEGTTGNGGGMTDGSTGNGANGGSGSHDGAGGGNANGNGGPDGGTAGNGGANGNGADGTTGNGANGKSSRTLPGRY